MVEERRARLERVGHRRDVHLHQQIAGQVGLDVDVEHAGRRGRVAVDSRHGARSDGPRRAEPADAWRRTRASSARAARVEGARSTSRSGRRARIASAVASRRSAAARAVGPRPLAGERRASTASHAAQRPRQPVEPARHDVART